jgi:hypothetical protein
MIAPLSPSIISEEPGRFDSITAVKSRPAYPRLAIFLLLGTALAISIRPTAGFVRLIRYGREHRATHEVLMGLSSRRPPNIDAEVWEIATAWAGTAYCNVCFSPAHVPFDELCRVHTDLDEALKGPVDLETIDWIWDRLGRTGPTGREYQERFELSYREELAEALKRSQARHDR